MQLLQHYNILELVSRLKGLSALKMKEGKIPPNTCHCEPHPPINYNCAIRNRTDSLHETPHCYPCAKHSEGGKEISQLHSLIIFVIKVIVITKN